MKPQDILFLLVLLFLLYKRRPLWLAIAGASSLAAAIPLYAMWVFFTAERFVWYAASCFLLSIILQLYYARIKES